MKKITDNAWKTLAELSEILGCDNTLVGLNQGNGESVRLLENNIYHIQLGFHSFMEGKENERIRDCFGNVPQFENALYNIAVHSEQEFLLVIGQAIHAGNFVSNILYNACRIEKADKVQALVRSLWIVRKEYLDFQATSYFERTNDL